MAYDENLAERVRLLLATETVTERKMFGGLSFLIGGNMAVGVIGDDLLVRAAREQQPSLLAMPHVRQMDFTGRPMAGWVRVGPAALSGDPGLHEWVDRSLAFARTLPPKHPRG